MNTRCFAYKENNTCFALNELYCKKEHCNFYKDKTKAKIEFFKNYDKSEKKIKKEIVNYFKKI